MVYRGLIPQLCACGCGEYAAVDERRNRVSKYKSGHNAKSAHPMKGKHHTPEARARLASYTGARASSFKHGWANTPTYKTWSSMLGRIDDPRNASYAAYGGRGITVCDRWRDFVNFLEDMGERPSKEHQLDRRDNDGPYSPENCRWLLRAENYARRKDPSGWIARRANRERTGWQPAPIKHGTPGGYQRCRKRPEGCCPECRTANSAYAAQRRQARRTAAQAQGEPA
jgi:hypothetical protein